MKGLCHPGRRSAFGDGSIKWTHDSMSPAPEPLKDTPPLALSRDHEMPTGAGDGPTDTAKPAEGGRQCVLVELPGGTARSLASTRPRHVYTVAVALPHPAVPGPVIDKVHSPVAHPEAYGAAHATSARLTT